MRNILEKYHNFPGFALLLGSFLWYTKARYPVIETHRHGIEASFYFICKRGEGHILVDMRFSALWGMQPYPLIGNISFQPGPINTLKFLTFLEELLENSERSKTHIFDEQRYAIASQECLQLFLCNHHIFSNRVVESTDWDDALRRNKPWLWKRRLGTHSKIRKGRNHLKVRQQKLPETPLVESYFSFPNTLSSPKYDYYRSLSYQWALDLFPFLLERSAISLQLADVLRCCTFTTMGQKFPRKMRVAKDEIAKYLVRVGSGVNDTSCW